MKSNLRIPSAVRSFSLRNGVRRSKDTVNEYRKGGGRNAPNA